MYIGRDFFDSDVGEDEVYTLNFARDIAHSETIVSATWSCVAVVGIDATASAHLFGACSFSGNRTSQRIKGLLAGVKYRLMATVVTSLGNTVSLWSHVQCNNPS